MLRTVEVGRAVLCLPTTNQELWLTTLITISPIQDSIDIQQLKQACLLDLLSSGNVWLGRAHGMHLEVTITLQGEPLAHSQLQDLAENITRGPVGPKVET